MSHAEELGFDFNTPADYLQYLHESKPREEKLASAVLDILSRAIDNSNNTLKPHKEPVLRVHEGMPSAIRDQLPEGLSDASEADIEAVMTGLIDGRILRAYEAETGDTFFGYGR